MPTFLRARYVCHKDEIAAVQAHIGQDSYNSPSHVDSVLPVIGSKQADLVANNHEILTGIHVRPTSGHSPGHYCIECQSGTNRAVMSGDLLHNPIQVAQPDWITAFCTDKRAAVRQRTVFIDQHTDQDITIFARHFGGPTTGRFISAKGGGRKFDVTP